MKRAKSSREAAMCGSDGVIVPAAAPVGLDRCRAAEIARIRAPAAILSPALRP